MNDHGLNEICDSHNVVLVDRNAIHVTKSLNPNDYKRVREAIGRTKFHVVIDQDEKIEYARLMKSLFSERDNFFITDMLAQEYETAARLLRSWPNAREPENYRRLLINVCNLARRRVIETNGHDNYLKRLHAYFMHYKGGISETDYDLIMTSLYAATRVGDTAILSNDVPLIHRFRSVAKELNMRGYNHHFDPVQHSVSIYPMLNSKNRFLPRVEFMSHSKAAAQGACQS